MGKMAGMGGNAGATVGLLVFAAGEEPMEGGGGNAIWDELLWQPASNSIDVDTASIAAESTKCLSRKWIILDPLKKSIGKTRSATALGLRQVGSRLSAALWATRAT
ncbi:MAG: hypothetical protein HKL96_09355 [Phycisphaerales bacterium]|nr:hypothetical protein [Phycisphaerales bacterium]